MIAAELDLSVTRERSRAGPDADNLCPWQMPSQQLVQACGGVKVMRTFGALGGVSMSVGEDRSFDRLSADLAGLQFTPVQNCH